MFQTQWVEINVVGENTGMQYFGKFCIKPYLTLAEKADAQRLADKWTLGMEDSDLRTLIRVTAFLSYYIVEADAPWWKDSGLTLMDDEPIEALSNKLTEIRTPKKEESK